MKNQPFKTLAVVADDFTLGDPAQQLVDRFLIGYTRPSGFHKPEGLQVRIFVDGNGSARSSSSALPSESKRLLEARGKDFGLVVARSLEEAVAGADGIILAPRTATGNADLLERVIRNATRGTRCFVHGFLAADLSSATALLSAVASGGLVLCAGTSLAGATPFPELAIPSPDLREVLVVVHGPAPACWLDGVEAALRPRSRALPKGASQVRFLEGQEVWAAGDRGEWSHKLLAAALSRSNTMQGGANVDGRSEDIWGLGLVPKLATKPQACMIEQSGTRTVLLQLTGAVKDINVAAETAEGKIVSAQLYRPPAPAREEFSGLAALLEQFFSTGVPPWPANRDLMAVQWMERIAAASKSA